MSRLLRRASFRHLRRHPWQLGLAMVGVTLGVAVVVSIDVANGSAQRAFTMSTDAVVGKATHQIVAGSAGLPEELYRTLRVDLKVRASAPVIEGWVSPIDHPQRMLRLLGLDPFAEAPFRTYVDQKEAAAVDLEAFLTTAGAALLATETANELALVEGDHFDVDIGGAIGTLTLIGSLRPAAELRRAALADLIVVDLATAQEVLGLAGRLTRIDLIVPEGDAGARLLAEVGSALPPDSRLIAATSRGETMAQMTRAFRLNLQALSLLALLCGAFLIYNTMTFAVVQRRELLATLRALGTTRRQILALVLGEALLIGIAGTLLGGGLGVLLGRTLVGLVTQTINDLYFVLSVREVAVQSWTLVKGAVVGLVVTTAAAAAPSWEAASGATRAALARSEIEARIHRAVPFTTLLGLTLITFGTVLLLGSSEGLLISFLGLFAVLMGLALLTPVVTIALMTIATPIAGRLSGQLGRLATRGVVSALSRTGIAIAALTMALSVTVGVDLMIRSFRWTVGQWLEYSLPADLYVSVFATPGRRFSGIGAAIAPATQDAIRRLPQVEAMNTLRHLRTTIDGREARTLALSMEERTRGAFSFKSGDPESAWRAFEAGEAVIVSEPFSFRTGVGVGDPVEMATPAGPIRLRVAGIFYDYSSEQGVVVLNRRLYRRLWNDDGATALSLHLTPGADLTAATAAVREAFGGEHGASVVTNRALRQQSMQVFDRTFLITDVLKLLAVMVAFVGILSALMALQLERTRELGVLRACGLTTGQLWRLVTQQTGLMGLTAGLFSIPVGTIMAAIMIYVINQRSFGWSLEMRMVPMTLAQTVVVAILAALLAGVYPAWRMARTSPAEMLREE